MSRQIDLGVVTPYGVAREAGYTGTKAQFSQELARAATAATDAETAKVDAQAAKVEAQVAATAAETAAASVIGFSTATVDANGHLILTKTNGATVDAGTVVGSDGKSAYQVAVDGGYDGSEADWLDSLVGAPGTPGAKGEKGDKGDTRTVSVVFLPVSEYPNESAAIAYMNAQGESDVIYVYNNKLFASQPVEASTQKNGLCLHKFRASGSSGIVSGSNADNRSLVIFKASDFTAPLTVNLGSYQVSTDSPYIYASTTPNTVSAGINETGSTSGQSEFTITATQLQSYDYVMFAIYTPTSVGSTPPDDFEINITSNNITTPITLKVLNKDKTTDSSEIAAIVSGISASDFDDTVISESVSFSDTGATYLAPVSATRKYLDDRATYLMLPPSGYCETKASYELPTGKTYHNIYPLESEDANVKTITSMLSQLVSDHADYITETTLGKDASNTYDIKKYVLDNPSTLGASETSAISTRHKPTVILTAGLHGYEKDAVHTVIHFMDDLCNHFMESEQLLYLRKNIKFVIIPVCNPWGYVNDVRYNSNDVDLNKNFGPGFSAGLDTGSAAYSEAETQLMKGVFDVHNGAIFHLEVHGQWGVHEEWYKQYWFSLMRSLNSELIEVTANDVNNLLGMRLAALEYDTNNSAAGRISYYNLGGRPKDYTGYTYGMLSATLEGSCSLEYPQTNKASEEYTINTQKVNCEALENFILKLAAALSSNVNT